MRITPLGLAIIGGIILHLGSYDRIAFNGIELLGFGSLYWAVALHVINNKTKGKNDDRN